MPLEKAVLPYLCSSVQVCSINRLMAIDAYLHQTRILPLTAIDANMRQPHLVCKNAASTSTPGGNVFILHQSMQKGWGFRCNNSTHELLRSNWRPKVKVETITAATSYCNTSDTRIVTTVYKQGKHAEMHSKQAVINAFLGKTLRFHNNKSNSRL